ncbi:KpsF/GutQ family sugar-phosphate isomerase [Sphingomonas sp. DT-207]|uniref:KpsF/GutQ family sugar-phosphate isomerase n=1 Tax=Sphingomonas sp. DT-207 TaxID=3396167 RepID=UPI003F1E08D5
MGRAVIAAEAEALWILGKELGEPFNSALGVFQRTRGRICVCGLGKSGHIARKIASTLAATGTPALFLHAAEAVHGDLGMLRDNDALLVLSNSGDTRELGSLARYADLLDIPIVAVTSSLASRLASAASVCILLPERPEACPHGSSPTTSTTMMLALGDAIAITLMKLRGTSAEELRCLHPGGRLGLDLVAIGSFMHRSDELPLVSMLDPMPSVIDMISRKGFGIAAVIDTNGNLAGIITDGDIRRHASRLDQTVAAEVMTVDPHVLVEDMLARDALESLSKARITSLLVVDAETERRVVGLVHVHDLLRLDIG